MENTNNNFAEFRQYSEKYNQIIEEALRENLPSAPGHIEDQFKEALEFALFSDEEKLRPILTLLGAELFEGRAGDLLPAAVAVEYIHTSSIVFDDLSVFNNSKNGKSFTGKFGEGLTVLVGLGFLNAAYPLVFVNHSGMPERAMQAHAEIVECVGAAGLIGGKSFQLLSNKNGDDSDQVQNVVVENLHNSAIMRLALRLGAILSGANYIELSGLSRFAELLGDAYQISIDLKETDGVEDEDFTVDEGKENKRLKMLNIIDEAKRVLVENFPSNEARTCLIQLTDYLAEKT